MTAYKCFTWQGNQVQPTMHLFASPIDALTCAVDYVKKGYKVKLGPECIQALEALKIPNRKGNGNVP